jgi:hypothetical protein
VTWRSTKDGPVHETDGVVCGPAILAREHPRAEELPAGAVICAACGELLRDPPPWLADACAAAERRWERELGRRERRSEEIHKVELLQARCRELGIEPPTHLPTNPARATPRKQLTLF